MCHVRSAGGNASSVLLDALCERDGERGHVWLRMSLVHPGRCKVQMELDSMTATGVVACAAVGRAISRVRVTVHIFIHHSHSTT